jgi:hypothetical protein
MRQEGEVADLLSVGRRAQLLRYLQDHPGLLWQAQVAARQFPQASSTLLVAAEVDQVSGGWQPEGVKGCSHSTAPGHVHPSQAAGHCCCDSTGAAGTLHL